ncbi:hypothetical protein AK830_g2706 [Neonectria ditissima]|uniref:DUF7603 domain-containing protein n=1 Tax=Neonectria ditissima TaxID=78410 RepID=A0A0N8H887_9HYPO|nr:hypothetical protein AK830_g2706 [Neonectria ditissima]
MEPALAAAPGPGVPLPLSSTSDSDTRSDTTTTSSDTSSASTSSDPVDLPQPSESTHHQSHTHRQLPPTTSPRITAVHARSQTVDCLPSSSSPIASASAVVSPAGTAAAAAHSSSGRPIKRKPLSSTASALALRFSSSGSPLPSPLELPKPEQRFARSCSVDSPTLYEFSPAARASPLASQPPVANLASHNTVSPVSRSIPAPALSPTESASDFSDVLDGYDDLIPDDDSYSAPDPRETVIERRDSDKDDVEKPDTKDKDKYKDEVQKLELNDKESASSKEAVDLGSDSDSDSDGARSTNSDNINSNTPPAPMLAPKPTPPHLKLDHVALSVTPEEPQSATSSQSPASAQSLASPQLNKPLPKSPGPASPFAALFNWAAPSPSATEFSLSTPVSPSRGGTANDTPYTTISNSYSERSKSNANSLGYPELYLSTPPTTAQLDEMEDELKAISVELASSIRREMDLEDLVDRLQEQINNPQAPGKRSSDYFSDSGYSSAKLSEADAGREEIEKIQRKSEQEKASIRLELTNKLQDERSRRKSLDQQIKQLAERASQIDLAEINNLDANGRLRDLENTCGDLRRRLSEERTVKNNFEDLLTALRGELHDACNERDTLRDEVIPQLRARVEGLESEAAEYSNLTYESSKMQQELHYLKKENENLRHSAASGVSTPPMNRMSRAMSGGLARSNSVATSSFRNQRPPALQLSRSNSVKNANAPVESREALAERLKDVEAQRDALHSALKNLLDRQDCQNRENDKKIRILQTERERLLSASPRRGGFERDISNLRTEINVLRRRAEEALEQKWQVEKGLGGLKMDLDRAEEEITLLRDLLKEKDILIPPSFARSSGSSNGSDYFGESGVPVTSESLERAYADLQAAYLESLERIKELEVDTNSDEKTQLAMQRLERTLSVAVSERDAAKHEIDALTSQFNNVSASESKTLESEQALADELSDSARRVEQLASQVQHQLATNAALRERLSATVARGEDDRKTNSDRIADLQVHLKTMEDQLIAAQTASEDRVTRHEEEIAALREAHNDQLRRMNSSPGLGGFRSPGLWSPRKPSLLSPLSPRFPLSPRAIPEKTFQDAAQMDALRARVSELEKALEDVENEMQEVVARMSVAQIEVLNLQEERETAVRETRRLQKMVETEKMKSFEERFRSLSVNA